jgi:hypothetical protein
VLPDLLARPWLAAAVTIADVLAGIPLADARRVVQFALYDEAAEATEWQGKRGLHASPLDELLEIEADRAAQAIEAALLSGSPLPRRVECPRCAGCQWRGIANGMIQCLMCEREGVVSWAWPPARVAARLSVHAAFVAIYAPMPRNGGDYPEVRWCIQCGAEPRASKAANAKLGVNCIQANKRNHGVRNPKDHTPQHEQWRDFKRQPAPSGAAVAEAFESFPDGGFRMYDSDPGIVVTAAEQRSEQQVRDESGLTADDWLAKG